VHVSRRLIVRNHKARIIVQSLASGERKTLVEGGSDARYVPTGHLVYAVGGSVFAVAFDVGRLEVGGGAVPMIEGVRRGAASVTGGAQFSFGSNGSLMYIPGSVSAQWDVALTDRKGGVQPLKLPPGPYEVPRVSPDGTRITFGTDDGKEAIVWVYRLSCEGAMQRVTFGGNNRFPVWSSDGKRVAFQSDRDGEQAIYWQLADGTGAAEPLTNAEPGESHEPESWSPKGDRLLFSITKGADVSLWMLSLSDRKVAPFGDVHSSTRTGAVFSPDGRWVAYASSEGSRKTIYVQPFPATGVKFQLFPKGAGQQPNHPLWSLPDGKQLFYNPGPGQFESVGVRTQPAFVFENPVAVPRPFPGASPLTRRPYDITPDGRFVAAIAAAQSESGRSTGQQIQVVLNWFEELRARVPVTK
jgi:serine/threonine-protein kinase